MYAIRSYYEAHALVSAFQEHDEKLLREQHAIHDSEEKLIQSSRETLAELESLLRVDSSK